MKAQFKYTFLEGLRVRGIAFGIIFIMNLVFIVLGFSSRILLPNAAHITFISLSGSAIAVMFAVNLIGDVGVIRRMFAPPGAYLCALTPVPRSKTLAASVLSMGIMDIVTMSLSILAVALISVNYAVVMDDGATWNELWRLAWPQLSRLVFEIVWGALLILAAYLYLLMIIIFYMVLKRSIFYHMHAKGVLAALATLGTLWVFNLSQFILRPFSVGVHRWRMFYIITVGGRSGAVAHLVLVFIGLAALFILSSRLMERKLNI